MSDFEPKIVGFFCNWCSYAGADLAGSRRLDVPPNLVTVKVMCSGRVEPHMILESFENGADGVLILGCHPGDCHYKLGNIKARRRYELLKKMLSQFNIEDERVRLDWVSATEADKFLSVVSDMTTKIKELGPMQVTE